MMSLCTAFYSPNTKMKVCVKRSFQYSQDSGHTLRTRRFSAQKTTVHHGHYCSNYTYRITCNSKDWETGSWCHGPSWRQDQSCQCECQLSPSSGSWDPFGSGSLHSASQSHQPSWVEDEWPSHGASSLQRVLKPAPKAETWAGRGKVVIVSVQPRESTRKGGWTIHRWTKELASCVPSLLRISTGQQICTLVFGWDASAGKKQSKIWTMLSVNSDSNSDSQLALHQVGHLSHKLQSILLLQCQTSLQGGLRTKPT